MAAGDRIYASDFTGEKWVAGAGITASSAAIAATETAVITTGTYLFKAGRAYKVVMAGGVVASVASNTPLFRIRKTNAVGAQFDAFRAPCISTASHPAHYTSYFRVGGTDVSAAICLTLTGSGAFTATLTAAATSPASINLFEVEDATGFGWAPTLV